LNAVETSRATSASPSDPYVRYDVVNETSRVGGAIVPRGRTDSELNLHERKRVAYDMFTRGHTNAQVASRLNVHPATVKNYREEYEEDLRSQMASNPGLLRNVLENTVRALAELDQVRQAAWDEYEAAARDIEAICPNCAHEFIAGTSASATTRNQILGQITKAQELRSKLLGLFGVKQEFLLHVQHVRMVQDTLLTFMREQLCAADKAKLEELLIGELGEHVTASSGMPMVAIDA
jgi:transposase-like protein